LVVKANNYGLAGFVGLHFIQPNLPGCEI